MPLGSAGGMSLQSAKQVNGWGWWKDGARWAPRGVKPQTLLPTMEIVHRAVRWGLVRIASSQRTAAAYPLTSGSASRRAASSSAPSSG
eukprot:6908489-Prymnesium_polylepis.1